MIDGAKGIYLHWFELDKSQREAEKLPLDVDSLASFLGVSVDELHKWGMETLENNNPIPEDEPEEPEEFKETRGRKKLPVKDNGEYDSVAWLKSRSHLMDVSLIKAIQKGNSAAMKLGKQLTGDLIEKSEQEVKIGLTADEIARRNYEAERRYQEWLTSGTGERPRVADVQEPSRLLSDEARLDSKQEHGEDNKVASVGLSDRPSTSA